MPEQTSVCRWNAMQMQKAAKNVRSAPSKVPINQSLAKRAN